MFRGDTQRRAFALVREQRNKNINSIPRIGIEPTAVVLQSHTCAPGPGL